jgi:preprotein translocase subunit YajC
MPGLIDAAPWIIAQNAAGGGGGGNASGGGLITFLPYVAIIGLWFYLLLIRPQQKQEKQRREMMNTLKKNDKVLTAAGIYGTVVSFDAEQDRVLLRVDDDKGTRIAFTKASIVRVLDGTEKGKEKASETA